MSDEIEIPEFEPFLTAVVTVDILNVRDMPNGTKIRSQKYGDIIKLSTETKDVGNHRWVRLANSTNWISAGVLDIVTPYVKYN